MTIYHKSISEFIGTDKTNIHFYWKGRVALYAALLAAYIKKQDEVIIPALTCVVVPNAIIYAGAKPIYVDVQPETLTIDVSKIKNAITNNTKAIIIQNTFGLSANIEEIIEIARSHNLLTIDDCTHGFGGKYNNHPNGTLTDAAFFSTQWNKPFSTGIGGILLINNSEKFPLINEVNKNLTSPKKIETLNLWLNILARKFLLTNKTYWVLLHLYRWLSKKGIVVGSSSSIEIESTTMPVDFHKKLSNMQATVGVRSLEKLPQLLINRKNAAIAYRTVLKKYNKWHINESFDKNNSHLKFPILVKDKKSFFAEAEKSNIKLSDWFLSPIHPVEKDFSNWFLNIEDIPNAYHISQKLITIHTDDININDVCVFLERNIHLIE